MISIINYGLGNLGSLSNMFRYLGIPSQIIECATQIKNVEKLLLPGVGSFDAGMENLYKGGWIEPLNDAVLNNKVPILGICLGMQLMTQGSQEGLKSGLGWINAYTKKFDIEAIKPLKIPHMGWTDVVVKKNSDYFSGIEENNRFYFVHSYYVEMIDPSDILVESNYGLNFTSGFERGNIAGVQFHPEKSHSYGKKFLERFSKI